MDNNNARETGGIVNTYYTSRVKMWDGSKWVIPRIMRFQTDTGYWYDAALCLKKSDTETVRLNEGRYQTTFFAKWSLAYGDLDKPENWTGSNGRRHGGKRGSERGYTSGGDYSEHFLVQGYFAQDPNGNMGSLFGFDSNAIQEKLRNADIESVQLYMRNIHSYSTGGNKIPMINAGLYHHNYKSQPSRIFRSSAFPDSNRIGNCKFCRGVTVQRTSSPQFYGIARNRCCRWPGEQHGGLGTGLLDWGSTAAVPPGYSVYIEGTGNQTRHWLNMPRHIGDSLRDGKISGFGVFQPHADTTGEDYGYWGGAPCTVRDYMATDAQGFTSLYGFNYDVSWQPQIRITYKQLNGK